MIPLACREIRPTLPLRANDGAATVALGGSVTASARIFADQWTLLILRSLFQGDSRFSELAASVDGVADGVLDNRLSALTAQMIVMADGTRGREVRYRLTDRGRDTFRIALAIWAWEFEWLPGAGSRRMLHATCGESATPVLGCGECRTELSLREVVADVGPGVWVESPQPKRIRRRATAAPGMDAQDILLSRETTETIGNFWSVAILAAAFVGVRRFTDFQRSLGIPPRVLSSRLDSLVRSGVFWKRSYSGHARRFDYLLTGKGKNLYHFILMLMRWGDTWLAPGGPPVEIRHLACEKRFVPSQFCSVCWDELVVDEVILDRAPRAS